MSNQAIVGNKSTIEFSPIIIGTMRLGEWASNLSTEELEKFIDACIDMGFSDFDHADIYGHYTDCLLYTSPSPRDKRQSRMPSSA